VKRQLGFLAVVAALLTGGLWYASVYDTAVGKCDRGDPGACAVLASRWTPTPWPTTQVVPLVSQPGGAYVAAPTCEWWVPGHDAFVLGWIRAGATCADIGALLPPTFTALPSVTSTLPPANAEMDQECSAYTREWGAVVVDVIGGAGYGTTACEGGLAPYLLH
jgi:hypothetical protein